MKLNNRKQPKRLCSGCGKSIDKAKKISGGSPYCDRCYDRLFVRAECTKCAASVRIMAADPAPICGTCSREGRLCVRCEKPVPRAGIRVGNGVACASCAPHYRIAEPCERCQTPSSKLSRIVGVTEERICPACRSKELNATCSCCGKHRPRHAITSTGKAVCKACAESPDAAHICPDCGISVGGTGEAPCLRCSFIRSLRRREAGLSKLLKQGAGIVLLAAFSDWCTRTDRSAKALAGFDIYAVAIARLDAALSADGVVDQALVASQFTHEELRRTGVFAQFLAEVGLHPPPQDLKDRTENKKLAVLLAGIRGETFEKPVLSYLAALESGDRTLSRRSVRTYADAAIRLWASVNARNSRSITQEEVDSFLRRQPGYRNSISAYLGFLSSSQATTARLKVPKKKCPPQSIRVARTAVEELQQKLKSSISQNARTAITGELLAELFGVHLNSILTLKHGDVRESPAGIEVNLGGWIAMSDEIGHWVRKVWQLKGAASAPTDWLFPGRVIASPLSAAAVNYHLRDIAKATSA